MRKIAVALCLVLVSAFVSAIQGGCPTCKNSLPVLQASDPALPVNGGWQYFNWYGYGQVFNYEGPFTFTSTVPVVLKVTDAFCNGDQFRIYDNGTAIGDTNIIASDYPACSIHTINPDTAWASSNWSHGSFLLCPGSHSITIQILINDYGVGTGYLRADSAPELTSSCLKSITKPKTQSPSLLPLANTNISKAKDFIAQADDLLSQAQSKNLDTAACEKTLDEAKSLYELARKYKNSPVTANYFALKSQEKFKQAIDCLKALLG